MAGKSITRGSRAVARAVDELSKNTLADVVLDRIALEVGEEATDEQVLTCLQEWLEPIQRLRGDKPTNLVRRMQLFAANDAKYIERQRQAEDERAAALPRERAMAARVEEINREKLKQPIS